jgi:hypothetical protein
MVPAPYSEEVWTGIEYQLASHLIMHDMIEEGLTCVRAARARYDGSRRNPWSEIECGSYYARAMSAYALVNAFSGLQVETRLAKLRFAPVLAGDWRLFWSGGHGWGMLTREGTDIGLSVLGGELRLHELEIAGIGSVSLSEPKTISRGERLNFTAAGGQLRWTGGR